MRIYLVNFIAILLIISCPSANAKPFFNPFNVAIKTNFAEDGNTFSFVYPRKSNQITFKFNSETINENKFDISGLFAQIARSFAKKFRSFNPFMFTTTTTTERNLDFSNEDTDDSDSVSSSGGSSSSGNESDSSTSSKEIENDNDNENTLSDGGVSSNGHEGYAYSSPRPVVTIEPVNVSYLPPYSTPSYIYDPPN